MPVDAEDFRRLLRGLDRGIQNLPGMLRRELEGRRGRIANRMLAKLTKEPGRPRYPLRWSSERQRKAFFASDGFGRGYPYRRRGTELKGWYVESVFNGEGEGAIILANESDKMTYIQGRQQQPFHRDTGWVRVESVLDDFYQEGGDTVIEVWRKVGDDMLLEAYRG